jgi:hypothetical protein
MTRTKTSKRITPDFAFTNHGSVCILTPLTDEARTWCEEHLPADRQTWCGGTVIEPRYVDDIINGLRGDGLTVD